MKKKIKKKVGKKDKKKSQDSEYVYKPLRGSYWAACEKAGEASRYRYDRESMRSER